MVVSQLFQQYVLLVVAVAQLKVDLLMVEMEVQAAVVVTQVVRPLFAMEVLEIPLPQLQLKDLLEEMEPLVHLVMLLEVVAVLQKLVKTPRVPVSLEPAVME